MNWLRQTFKYFGWFTSTDEQPLKDDFHRRNIGAYSEENLSQKTPENVETIKTFAKKYPLNTSEQSGEVSSSPAGNSPRRTEGTKAEISAIQRDPLINEPSDILLDRTRLDEVDLHGDTIDLIDTCELTENKPPEVEVTEKQEKKKSKRAKKVRKRVRWVVRRSWKWLKRGWSGYAPGVSSGLMYCANAPATIFNIYNNK
ncbi:hypothetical protein SNE40_008660 [Patella caerulea]|uniref:Uncharacterized protein n=1 Tax=Patella caerulea TaxID=87958 RepID=A0AAN8JQG3_PATCE